MKNLLNDRHFLYEEYITKNKSCREIGKLLNISGGTIHTYLKKFGIIQIKKDDKRSTMENSLSKKYGMMTIVKITSAPAHVSNQRAKYQTWVECKCDCGNTSTKMLNSLKNGLRSCGCLRHRRGSENPGFIGYKGISGKIFTHIKRTAAGGTNKRKRVCKEFKLTIEFLWDLYIKQERKCALSGIPIEFSDSIRELGTCSLDRIDSSTGYLEDNVQWVHKQVNIMKNKYDQLEFIKMCKLISDHSSMVSTV
jgi:hypothetical protein